MNKVDLSTTAIIVNPIAGRRKRRNTIAQFLIKVKNENPEIAIFKTSYAGNASQLAKDLLLEGFTTIVSVGGDGTLNEIARELVHKPAKLGIIPAGSGNGLARHLKIPINPLKAWEIIIKGSSTTIDSALINDLPFFSIAGIGFDATVASEFSQMKGRGFINYLRATIRLYFRYKPRKYKLIINNQVYACKALFISFANSNQFGYNTSIAPKADLKDGMIDVCIMQKVPLGTAPLIVPKLFSKRLDKTRYLHIIKSKELKVIRKKTGYIHIDGDPQLLEEKEICIKVLPSSINIITP